MLDRAFYIILFGFVAGVLMRSFFDFGFSFVIFLFLLSIAIIFSASFSRPNLMAEPSSWGSVFLIALFVFSLGFGVFRMSVSGGEFDPNALADSVGERIKTEGIIKTEPIQKETSQQFVLDAEKEDSKTRIIVIADTHPKFKYGDAVVVSGKLDKPKSFETEGGKLFDYPAYLAKDNIYYQMFYPEVEFISSGNANFIKGTLFTLKSTFLSNVSRIIPEPHPSLLGGLVVGAQESLGDELQEKFRETGIIHIVVLSGYNVTIVAEGIMRFFSFLPGVFKTSLGVSGIVLFALMTGASATTVRASIMALLVVAARSLGRKYDITRALLIAGLLMLIHNPKILAFDPSFQLSFAATLGLIYLAPLIERHLGFVPTKWQFREFATATIATQIFVLPLLLVRTGELSIVALPVNLLVLGAVPLTMLTGFITGITGFISTLASLPFGFITYALLAYILGVVDLFSVTPFASVGLPFFPVWLAVLIYIVYALFFYFVYKKKKQRVL